MDPDVGCLKNTIKLNHSLTHIPVKLSLYGQLHPLTLFRMIATLGTSKQVTFVTGFSNTVNASLSSQTFTGNIKLHTSEMLCQSYPVTHMSLDYCNIGNVTLTDVKL